MESLFRGAGQFWPATGVGPRRGFIGPTASEFDWMSWKRESGFPYHYGLDPIYLNVGLMKPRRGLALAAGGKKLGVGKNNMGKGISHQSGD